MSENLKSTFRMAEGGATVVTNSTYAWREPKWVCEKHGETDKTISFIYENGAWRATYCLECLVEKIGLPNIEDTRK